uniref:Integrin, alpha V n=1 Tax=Amphiprion percula TaxID=161767 RepID=A0A3P8TU30_AMPPE
MAGGRAAVGLLVLAGLFRFQPCGSFNLDVDKPSVFSGPEGSYFGFSVDFFKPQDNQRSDVLIGAPRANISSSNVVERGAVYSCPWRASSSCQMLQFDNTGTRNSHDMEFKSKQWFGASVRSDGEHILACAPLYQWSTFGVSEREPVGTCYLKKGDKVVEYSPCRSCEFFSFKNNKVVVGGPGSFYWQGQLISDDVAEIFTRFDRNYITQYSNTMATKSAGMAAYFGHSVAASDVNNDGLVDLLVGAPLFMDRGSDGKLREVGQVSVYLGRSGFSFHPPQLLTGSEVYARYGSAIAALGDLDMDGYNDVAISAPYGGFERNGLVYIHNGGPRGPDSTPSQVLEGKWASSYMPASFGYSLNGNTDIDQNGYPGTNTHKLLSAEAQARPVISVNATLDMTPQIINPEEKNCKLPGTNTPVSCFKVKYCLKASGRGAPATLNFRVDLMLDRLKQKEATKRALFLHSRSFQYSKNMTVNNGGTTACEEQEVFLRDDGEFRDKITPISVVMEYSLDYQRAADQSGLLPILDMSAPSNVTKQAHILLDCGEDNICKPDLKLSVKSDREQIYIGDDNALTLEVSAENQGEGAYEAELHVYPPQQADFTGVVRSQTLSRLSCAYKKENQTKMVVCDLGNPMKGGTKILAELRFSVHQLSEDDTSVKFDLQIAVGRVFSAGRRLPVRCCFPIANWKPKEPPVVGDDIGPQIVHVYELLNSGPSTFNGSLLYITSYETEGPINCTTEVQINPLNVSVRQKTHKTGMKTETKTHLRARDATSGLDCNTAECLRLRCQVGRLERRKNAILFIYSRLDVNNFLRVNKTNKLTNLSFFKENNAEFFRFRLLKFEYFLVSFLCDDSKLNIFGLLDFQDGFLGFFKRVRPPQDDCTEKEQLQPEENGNTDA